MENNTSSQFPPDFINEYDKIMMEIMRVDDHSKNGKKNKYREGSFYCFIVNESFCQTFCENQSFRQS